MKKNLFRHVPENRLLMASYGCLLFCVILVRASEYFRVQQAGKKMQTIARTSNRKLQLLAAIRQQLDSIQVQVQWQFLVPGGQYPVRFIHQLPVRTTTTDLLNSFLRLGVDSEEQAVLNTLQQRRMAYCRRLDSLQRVPDDGLSFHLRSSLLIREKESYKQLIHMTGYLETVVRLKSEKEISELNALIQKLLRNRLWASGLVIFLLLVLGVFISNTIRKMRRVNAALAASEHKYRELLEHTDELILQCDGKGHLVYANTACREKLFSGEATLSAHQLLNIVLGDAREDFRWPPAFSKRELRISNIHRVFTTPSGQTFYLDGHIVLHFKGGRFKGAEAFFRDVSIQRQLQEELVTSEHKYRILFDFSSLPKYFVDAATYQILEVNRAALDHYGYSRNEFTSKTLFELWGMENNAASQQLRSEIERFAKTKRAFTIKASHFKKGGLQMNVEIHTSIFYVGDKKMFLMNIRDVTEKLKQERAITKAIIEAQEAERRELGRELHDNICQILTTSELFINLLQEHSLANCERYVTGARNAIRLAQTEIRNLSHQLAPAFFEEASLGELFSTLISNMDPGNRRQIHLCYDPHLDGMMLATDIKLNLYRILQEQLKNILKHAGATHIRVELFCKNNRLVMRTTDNGKGFEASRAVKGIGLLNMKKRVDSFSGHFSLQAAPGKGCSITIEMPLSVDPGV